MAVLGKVVVLGVLGLVLASGFETQMEVRCPSVDPPTPVMFPDNNNCSRYFVCNHGEAVLMECGPGTWFNPKLDICDWPEHSGCKQTWTCPPFNVTEPWRDTYAYPGNCSKYYLCWNGNATVESCDEGLYFNDRLAVCDTKEDSGCVQPPQFVCPPPDPRRPWRNNYVHPDHCSFFYTCVGGEAYLRKCPSGLIFLNTTQQCDWRSKDPYCTL